MRRLAAGNWKMNGSPMALSEVTALLKDHPSPGCEMLLCPPATLIAQMAWHVRGAALSVGGQNCHSAASGAHTGDISATMLAEAGASYVILGHSERRADHGETDALVRAKPTDSQGGKSAHGRRENVRTAFAVTEAGARRVRGRRMLLVDDVLTTGATAEACAAALLKAGARAVDLAVVARVRTAREVTI